MRAEVPNLGITANVCQNYAGNLPMHYGMLIIFLIYTHWTSVLLLPRHDNQDCRKTLVDHPLEVGGSNTVLSGEPLYYIVQSLVIYNKNHYLGIS